MKLADALAQWHEFYGLVGTASATMVGLLFVAASVGTGVFSADRRAPLRVFLSASVVNFSCVLGACVVLLAPVENWLVLGGLVAGCGLLGLLLAVGIHNAWDITVWSITRRRE